MKKFNTQAVCIPSLHYMVDLSSRIEQIKAMVKAGSYFTINRARQYGKTTTLNALKKALIDEYTVLSLNFQSIDDGVFTHSGTFSQALARIILDLHEFNQLEIPGQITDELNQLTALDPDSIKMDQLFRIFKRWCAFTEKPVVLMIDEIDSATNNQVFLDFLALLRDGYISRSTDGTPAFQSVILAGVTDVKYLRSRIRDEDQHKINSPWNIAADFRVDMSFNVQDIKGMLAEYEADHMTGMDTPGIAEMIYTYTDGYPYLVSRICELIDEQLVPGRFATLMEAWSMQGVDEAVKMILADGNSPLFGSIMGKLANYPQLKSQLRRILMQGDVIPWLPDNEEQRQLYMYGFIKNKNNTVAVSNRIFEMRLYQYFLGETKVNDAFRQDALANKSIFINEDRTLNMPLIMQHFAETQHRIHEGEEVHFLEEEGRERFLTYLSPIINGTGTYSIEEQTRDQRRMDVVIHYLGKRYIIEMKIWRGQRYNEKGEKQIMEYMDSFGLTVGYMISFNAKEKANEVKRVNIGDKVLYEVSV